MKKELFNKLINQIMTRSDLYSTHKVTYKSDLEVHTFGAVSNKELVEAKELFKTKGYKSEVYEDAQKLASQGKLGNIYLTILYAKDKDKISISLFNVGYAYSYYKKRFYPLKKNTPVFAWTKHMYDLQSRGRGRFIPNPRIQLGSVNLYGTPFVYIGEIITKTLLQVDYLPQAQISYRHFINTKNDLEAMSNMFGVKIPQVLQKFPVNDVLILYKTIKDYNQINKLCQFIAKNPTSQFGLYQIIAEMLFNDPTQYWLVTDYIGDNLSLKTKNVSLKITSIKRWQDEHRKATAKRMLKGVPEIKVNDVYKKALEGLEYPYELIETKDKLIQESVELGHCVATYANKINSGDCGIFSVEYEGKRYTLEVKANQFDKGIAYVPVQFRGLHNCAAPDVLLKTVCNLLYKNSDTNASRQTIERSILGIQDLAPVL